MALIDFDKFLASFITEMRECSQMRNFSIPRCIKKALDDQGLDYKGGEIIKTQRRISAEAKEVGYDKSEEERIRKSLIRLVHLYGGEFGMIDANTSVEKALTWLEKQADVNLKEYVFRPLAGCDINTAAIQAVEQQKLGKKIILAFNGAYIPIEEKTADDIVNEYYSWLEKQGNPNTEYWKGYKDGKKAILDKYSETCKVVEPKFKVGDWVVWDNKISCHIDNIYQGKESLMYTITDVHNMTRSYSVKGFDNNAHLWTIQDAKDGDVLTDDYGIYIFDRFDEYDERCFLCMGAYQYSQKMFENEHMLCSIEVHPATKEQRELLFKKMHEAGYMWDSKSKQLLSLKAEPSNIQTPTRWSEEDKLHIRELESLVKQVWAIAEHENDKDNMRKMSDLSFFLKTLRPQLKQEWSEEDEIKIKSIIAFLKSPSLCAMDGNKGIIDENIKYLKSLKDRVQPQLKQEWKQENREELTEFENAMMHIGGSFFGENAGLDPNDTATIKEQAKLLLELAPKIEWSEEDKEMFDYALDMVEWYDGKNKKRVRLVSNWLKSIKDRYTWKPSKEQMHILSWIANVKLGDSVVEQEVSKHLNELYKDLKKLREE